jgi:hypothetical protein
VFQIDEFWSRTGDSRQLLDLGSYWEAPLGGEGGEDTYRQYTPLQRVPGSRPSRLPTFAKITTRRQGDPFPYPRRPGALASRAQFFIAEPVAAAGHRDRIPYLWDFGFLLARKDLWYAARDLGYEGWSSYSTVADVWDSLCLPADRIGNGNTGYVSWTTFYKACRAVAQNSGSAYLPFHVDPAIAESPLSLLLEIWATVNADGCAVQGAGERVPWIERLDAIDPNPAQALSLRSLIADDLPSLFIAMITFATMCRHLTSDHRVLRVAPGAPTQPVAERHWYSTASAAMKNAATDLAVLRLPGVCSTRGDWSLAVAGGSRSELVARRALDLLSSRQMALLRLHSGYGLPTRDVLPDEQIGNALTALRTTDPGSGRRRSIRYGELCLHAPDHAHPRFRPLRRSRLQDYGRHAFFARRFLARAMEEIDLWYDPSFADPDLWDLFSTTLTSERAAGPNAAGPIALLPSVTESFDSAAMARIAAFSDLAALLMGALDS